MTALSAAGLRIERLRELPVDGRQRLPSMVQGDDGYWRLPGDPLPLPGYPFTFLVFKQIAADDAAIVTEAFLNSWAGP